MTIKKKKKKKEARSETSAALEKRVMAASDGHRKQMRMGKAPAA